MSELVTPRSNCSRCGYPRTRTACARCLYVEPGDGDDSGPPDCPGMGIDDLCTWPDIEGCGLCTLGMNPEVLR